MRYMYVRKGNTCESQRELKSVQTTHMRKWEICSNSVIKTIFLIRIWGQGWMMCQTREDGQLVSSNDFVFGWQAYLMFGWELRTRNKPSFWSCWRRQAAVPFNSGIIHLVHSLNIECCQSFSNSNNKKMPGVLLISEQHKTNQLPRRLSSVLIAMTALMTGV